MAGLKEERCSRPKCVGAHIRPKADGAKIRPRAIGAKIRPRSGGSKIAPFVAISTDVGAYGRPAAASMR